MIYLYIYLGVLVFMVLSGITNRIAWAGQESLNGSDKMFAALATICWPFSLTILVTEYVIKTIGRANYWSEPRPVRTPAKVLRERRENALKQVDDCRDDINAKERELGMELTVWR